MKTELYHYGVIGMRWGQHKARTYAGDKNAYIRKQNDKAAKARYKSGKTTKSQYKGELKRNRTLMRKKNLKVINETSKLTVKKGEKISSIYKKYEKQAVKTIPHYKLKKGSKMAAKLLLKTGLFAMTGTNGFVGFGKLMVANGFQIAAKGITAKALATGLVKEVATDAGKELVINEAKTEYGKRKEGSK